MLSNLNFMDYFREVANSAKFQISAALSFGSALYLIWFTNSEILKIVVTVLFLFPAAMLFITLVEKLGYFFYQKYKRNNLWNSLTKEEISFISYYINNKTKTRYVTVYNGTYKDSGIINPLINKGILYRASDMTEFRGSNIYDREQCFPFNIHDNAYNFYNQKTKKN